MTRRALVAGALAAAGMLGFYAGVLVWAGGLRHLEAQARADW